MSRIGHYPVNFPDGVKINIDNNLVSVEGPKGKLSQKVDERFKIDLADDHLVVNRPSDSKEDKALHGLFRSLIVNMVEGVTKGYTKELVIEGTGYRAEKAGNTLKLHLGFSHDVNLEDPEGIETKVPDPNHITISGCDKQQVGNYSAVIRDFRKPEPYKGKGIRYKGEHIRRKVGKTGA